MHILNEKLRAPELKVDRWLTHEPLSMAGLRGRVVLIDFWDFSCVNCLHTLPYLKVWHMRYAEAGLTIIGIHAPEFSFAREAEQVTAAVARYDLPYPIALDNAYRTWDAFANRAWPGKYLIDKDGYIRAYHHGEGEYQDLEALIQRLLHEIEPARSFPAPLAPLLDIDQPGAVCQRSTPELYLGYVRGELGNRQGNPPDQVVDYLLPAQRLPDTVYLEGAWLNGREAVESVMDQPARIELHYRAAKVNLVMGVAGDAPVPVAVTLDGRPVPPEHQGEDLAPSGPESVIEVSGPRLYALVAHPDFQAHRLGLTISMPGLRAYAFTFVSCAS